MSKRSRGSNKPTLAHDVDIVIPVYGNFELLKKTIDALPEACGSKTYKLIIVDNGSPVDDISPYDDIQKQYPDTRVIKNKENLGYAKACNQGASSGRSSIILHLNSDCIMHPGSIEKMVKDMSNSAYGIVAPKLIFPSEAEYVENGFDNIEFTNIRPASTIQHVGLETNINGDFYHIFVGWSIDNPRANRIEFPYAVTGACLMTRRSLWSRIRGFNLIYGQGTYEDIDYCLTVRELGYNIHVVQDAVGTHYVSATAYKYQLPMPLGENKQIFLSRWGQKLEYSEWRYA